MCSEFLNFSKHCVSACAGMWQNKHHGSCRTVHLKDTFRNKLHRHLSKIDCTNVFGNNTYVCIQNMIGRRDQMITSMFFQVHLLKGYDRCSYQETAELIITNMFAKLSSSQVSPIILSLRHQEQNIVLSNFSAYLLCSNFCLLRCQCAIPKLNLTCQDASSKLMPYSIVTFPTK